MSMRRYHYSRKPFERVLAEITAKAIAESLAEIERVFAAQFGGELQ